MKRCSAFQLVMLLFVIFQATAMEKDALQNPSIPIKDICYFNKLNNDLLNYLSPFLVESEKDFVERTKTEKLVPPRCYSFFPSLRTDIWITKEHPLYSKGAFYCLSPDENKVAKFDLCAQPVLMVFDLKKDKPFGEYKGIFEEQHFRGIALSSCGNKFLTLGTKSYWKDDTAFCIDAIVELHNTITQKKQILYSVEDNDCCETIAFNKQGTSCIVHCRKDLLNTDVYKIFSLVNEKNRFQDYLRNKCICNNYVTGHFDFFKKLPVDICNYIAHFLNKEKRPFVARTSKLIHQILPIKSNHFKQINDMYETVTKGVFCPDETKVALITLSHFLGEKPLVKVVQLPDDTIIHQGNLAYRTGYETFALSPSGTTVATIYKQERDPHSSVLLHDYHYMLALQKIDLGDKKEFDIAYVREPLFVYFNKQETFCIIYGTDYREREQHKCYQIFSLKDNTWSPLFRVKEKKDNAGEQKVTEKYNELLNYFRHRGVCKNIPRLT